MIRLLEPCKHSLESLLTFCVCKTGLQGGLTTWKKLSVKLLDCLLSIFPCFESVKTKKKLLSQDDLSIIGVPCLTAQNQRHESCRVNLRVLSRTPPGLCQRVPPVDPNRWNFKVSSPYCAYARILNLTRATHTSLTMEKGRLEM
jgi:hypothetical protein